MSAYDYSYSLPENFKDRVIQNLRKNDCSDLAAAFNNIKYEYNVLGFAYYEKCPGAGWNTRAMAMGVEGRAVDIRLLESRENSLKEAINKALNSGKSGLILKEIEFYHESNENEFPQSDDERLNTDIEVAKLVLKDILEIGERLCVSSTYNSKSSEDSMNDYFRDMLLSKGYKETKDQSRHGVSSSGNSAGEVDLLITKEGKEIAIIEGMKLSSVRSSYIDLHIEKAIDNYNALGTPTFIMAYVSLEDFTSFWQKYIAHIKNCNYGVHVKREIRILTHLNASTRVAEAIFSRDEYDFPVYFIAFKIRMGKS